MKYALKRLYPLEQFANLSLEVSELDTIEEMKTELKKFDQLADAYKNRDTASKSGRCPLCHKWLVYNPKTGQFFEKEPNKKLPVEDVNTQLQEAGKNN